ncbi:hypothetical protein CYMTET_16087 [Cymbomonas tetramitiformis]|uniref:EF-hand domain-containing protein n=1 Tax=Cymbomonas tetramitiformis TaxID=36881 RepID=A0AAE0GCP7_9CHLO|nr:hypothetical protein CYMTET_16087 [Cymbomonas tetramitiformis]
MGLLETGFFERFWYDNVKGLLTFTAQKEVVIADWRLGLLFRTLQLPVLCYVLYLLVYKQNFLVQGPVLAVFSMYTSDAGVREHQEDVRQVLRNGDEGIAASFCASAGLNPCASDSEAENLQQYYSAVTQESNDVGYFLQLDDRNGSVCTCKANRGRFTIGTENVTLSIDHYYHSDTLSGQLVKTYVRNVKNNAVVKKFDAGYTLNMTVQELLQWAEVSLDERCDEGSNSQWLTDQSEEQKRSLQGPQGYEEGRYPHLRTSGLSIEVTMEYYNYRLAQPSDLEGLDDIDKNSVEKLNNAQASTVCIMTLRPYLVWTSQGHDLTWTGKSIVNRYELGVDKYRYGVLLSFKSGGTIAYFDYFNLITALTQGLVLLSTVSTLVSLFIQHGYENIYSNMLQENCDARSEYARFAVRALVASVAFDLLDDSDNGILSKTEVFKKLRLLFYKHMSYSETATLVEFIMYMAQQLELENTKQSAAYKIRRKAAKSFQAIQTAFLRRFDIIFQKVESCLSKSLPEKSEVKKHDQKGKHHQDQKCIELVQGQHSRGDLQPESDIFQNYAEVEKLVTETISKQILTRLKNRDSVHAFREALEVEILPPDGDPEICRVMLKQWETDSEQASQQVPSAPGLPSARRRQASPCLAGEGRVPQANSVSELTEEKIRTLAREQVLDHLQLSSGTHHEITDTEQAESSLLMVDGKSIVIPTQDAGAVKTLQGSKTSLGILSDQSAEQPDDKGRDIISEGLESAEDSSTKDAHNEVVVSVQRSGTQTSMPSAVLMRIGSTVGTLDKESVLTHIKEHLTSETSPTAADVQEVEIGQGNAMESVS